MSDDAMYMSTSPFNVPEARRILQEGDLSHSGDKHLAAYRLMENCEHDLQITLSDMLRCLDYGGAIATVGARCLYVRTGRDGLGWLSSGLKGVPFVVDRADWEDWLREHGLAEGEELNA